jgi:hypothetical protein
MVEEPRKCIKKNPLCLNQTLSFATRKKIPERVEKLRKYAQFG